MALDPSISLQGKTPDIAGNVASIASAVANIAAIPGIQADSAIKQRTMRFNNWMTKNSGQYISQPKDANGNPIGGQPIVDHGGLTKAAADAGFLLEAQTLAANDLKNQSTILEQGQTQATTAGTLVNNANNANALAVSARGYVATFMQAYHEQNPNATPQELDAMYNKQLKGVGYQTGKGLSVPAIFGQPDIPEGAQGQGSPAMWRYDPLENKAMLTATMSPLVQADLKLRQEVTAQSGVTGQSGPAYRDPNSNETRQARAAAIAFDPMHKDIYANMTAAQLAVNPVVGGAVGASINPASARVDAATNFTTHLNASKSYSNAAEAVEQFKAQLPPEEQERFRSGPIAWFQNNVNKFGNNPAFVSARFAVENVANGHPEMKLSTLDAGSLGIALRRQQALELDQAGSWGERARSPTVGGGTEPRGTANLSPNEVARERDVAQEAIDKGADAAKVRSRFKERTGEDL